MKKLELTSFHLHVLAMALMLCDHMWVSLIPGNDWMTWLGRMAFPIFAFLCVEGFFHTKDLKKHFTRMLLFAAISEIPFNLLAGSRIFYPVHQNVLLTFSIGIGLMWINENAKDKNPAKRISVAVITVLMGFILGVISFCDYNHAGVLTVLVFYFFRGRNLKNFILQFICLWYINTEILAGFYYEWNIFGMDIEVLRQSFALFAIIPIWLYKGKQGPYNRGIKELYYWFYPVHLFVLWVMREIIA